MKALGVTAFKKRFGLSQAELNELVRTEKVSLQQNGYVGDSSNHHKLVVFVSDAGVAQPGQRRILVQRDPPSPAINTWRGPVVDRESQKLFNQHKFRNWRLYR